MPAQLAQVEARFRGSGVAHGSGCSIDVQLWESSSVRLALVGSCSLAHGAAACVRVYFLTYQYHDCTYKFYVLVANAYLALGCRVSRASGRLHCAFEVRGGTRHTVGVGRSVCRTTEMYNLVFLFTDTRDAI